MGGSKNSKNSRRSSRGPGSQSSAFGSTVLCFLASAAVIAAAIAYFYNTGSTLYSGDAEAHLDIARRIIDSRTPGWSQVGTTWLPLPHLLMIPLVRNDWMWTTGMAGAIVSGASMSLAAAFLFASVHRSFLSTAAASAAAAVFLLNPNTLYIGSIPMTESTFFAALFGLLYFTVRFGQTQGWGALGGAAVAALAGSLTRYEAWFLLPFAAIYILLTGRGKRWYAAAIFCIVAGAGPLLWLAHNRWYFGDPLYFYRGPYSALAIQGKTDYPGRGDWRMAARYFFAAAKLVAGWPAVLVGGGGALAAVIFHRVLWPVIFLMLPPVFYVWSIHSSGNAIFVPTLSPHTWYNTRYALALLPLVALGIAALVPFAKSFEKHAVFLLTAIALLPFLVYRAEHAIVREEAEINSRARRQWVSQASAYLRTAAGPHETFFTSFGDLTAIYRTLGIPLRDTLTGDNDVEWAGVLARPDLFLHTDWAVVTGGDMVQGVIDKARLRGPRYLLQKRVVVKGAPVVEIYRRIDENTVY